MNCFVLGYLYIPSILDLGQRCHQTYRRACMLCVAAGLCIRVPGTAYCIVLCSKDVLAPCNLLRIYFSLSGIFSVHFDLVQNLVAESDTLRRSLRSYPDMMTSLLGKMTRHSLCHVGHSLMALPALYLHLRLHHVCFRGVDQQKQSIKAPIP